MFLIQPVAAVYYPVEVLPPLLQQVAALLPPSYVFEGMRMLLLEGRIELSMLASALLLDALWLAAAGLVFAWLFKSARRRGLLLQVGE